MRVRASVLVVLLLAAACRRAVPTTTTTILPLRERSLAADSGVRIFYRLVGAGADTLVFIHGGPGGNSAQIHRDLPWLSVGHVAVYYDQRGGGQSSLPRDTARLTLDDHVRDLEALRRELGLRRMVLVANDWGSMVAARYAIAHPDQVSRMVFLSPLPPRMGDWPRVRVSRLAGRLSQAERARVAAAGRGVADGGDPITTCREVWRVLTSAELAHREKLREVQEDPCAASPDALRYAARYSAPAGWGSLGRWDFTRLMGAIAAPVLVVVGDRDATPLENVREWAAVLPEGRVLVVPDAGHYPFVERPEVVSAAVAAFLGGGWPVGAAR